jgi:hypothetical protein
MQPLETLIWLGGAILIIFALAFLFVIWFFWKSIPETKDIIYEDCEIDKIDYSKIIEDER